MAGMAPIWHVGAYFVSRARAAAFCGLIRNRRPSGVVSAVLRMIAMTCGGVSFGFTARIFAARFAAFGAAIELPDIRATYSSD